MLRFKPIYRCSEEIQFMNYQFTLDGAVTPKARPRVTDKGTYLPSKYRNWRTFANFSLLEQSRTFGITQPLEGVAVQIDLMGKHPVRGDLDNIAGSILDALVSAQVLRDDSIRVVTKLAIALHWSKEPPIVTIRLEQQT
jgi:Holliday junction resolvase RusA-like endonuclease